MRDLLLPFFRRLHLLTSPSLSRRQYENDTPTTARDKFGNQKGISSDMYFERGTYDAAAQSEAQTRLQNFQGATAISSSAYFGRDEEEELAASGRGNNEGLLGDGSLAGLETAARDIATKVLSNPDVQNAAESIRTYGLKVCFVFRFQIPGFDIIASLVNIWGRCRKGASVCYTSMTCGFGSRLLLWYIL